MPGIILIHPRRYREGRRYYHGYGGTSDRRDEISNQQHIGKLERLSGRSFFDRRKLYGEIQNDSAGV